MNRSLARSLAVFVLMLALAATVSADIIGYTTPNTNLGWSATNATGQQVTWNTRFVAGEWKVVRLIGTTETIFSAPAGVTLTSAVIRPSELGTYGGVFGTCAGGVTCAVVFSGSNSATTISQPGSDLQITQLFENQTWVATPENGASAVRGSFSSGTPTGSLATPPAGYIVTTTAAVSTTTGYASVGVATNDGITGHAFVSDDAFFSLLPSLTNNSGAFAMSPDGNLITGYDGMIASMWNRSTGLESFFALSGGGFQTGYSLSILDGGSASGLDENGVGWIFSPFFGVSQTTCQFITAVGGTLPTACSSGGIGRTVLSQYLDPFTSMLTVSLAGQGSVIDYTGINPIYFNQVGWVNGVGDDTSGVPEPGTWLLMGAGLLALRAMNKKRSA